MQTHSIMAPQTTAETQIDQGLRILGPPNPESEKVLTPQATAFVAGLVRRFAPRVVQLLDHRRELQARGSRLATLMMRPRGWHLFEKHMLADGRPVPAALFDFGLYFFHNACRLLAEGTGPYVYLPKLESHLEARLWNEVFLQAQREFGLPPGRIKATVLIETLPAAFQMDEILYELREHSAGLNLGRWDYIFSFIKMMRAEPGMVLPDRARITMDQPFLRACRQLLIRVCHRRGAHAMGGMAAQIPVKNDP